MKYKFFRIPVLDPQESETELNSFLTRHRIVTVEKHFLQDAAASAWAFCVTYTEQAGSSAVTQASKAKIDYREVLTPEQFSLYLDLKAIRKKLAEAEGIAAFSVFTNAQLAAMIQKRVTTRADLADLPGVGASRLTKFADHFLAVLRDEFLPAERETHAETNED